MYTWRGKGYLCHKDVEPASAKARNNRIAFENRRKAFVDEIVRNVNKALGKRIGNTNFYENESLMDGTAIDNIVAPLVSKYNIKMDTNDYNTLVGLIANLVRDSGPISNNDVSLIFDRKLKSLDDLNEIYWKKEEREAKRAGKKYRGY